MTSYTSLGLRREQWAREMTYTDCISHFSMTGKAMSIHKIAQGKKYRVRTNDKLTLKRV